MRVIYEDNHCIAVIKPHGQLTQSDSTGDRSLMDEVREMIRNRDGKPGAVFLGLLHRLDRPVGGIVLFAKTGKGASRLSEQFRSRRIVKTYLAVAEGRPTGDSGTVRQWLVKDRGRNVVRSVPKNYAGAKEAVTDWRVVSENGGRSLLEIGLKTGRAHQIRSALSSLGTPILGDLKYGSRNPMGEAIALFACGLVFFQPVTGEAVRLQAEPELQAFLPFA
ncbi:RluA family pseudouridine synthase [Candidatus Uhrbacteria bacterium]|nr:RluA family pseudouridine synthase [Candidatus Uhrbacteria bacterium]